MQRAWQKYLAAGKTLRYRHEGLRTGLPAELARAVEQGICPDQILVVACHACQHLSDEALQIACRHGVHAAIMPCCQRDLSPGNSWKMVSKRLGVPMEIVMDILLAGKAMSWTAGRDANTCFDVRMKVLEGSSTPQNRLILSRADATFQARRSRAVDKAQNQLDKAYERAHVAAAASSKKMVLDEWLSKSLPFLGSFFLGVAVTAVTLRR